MITTRHNIDQVTFQQNKIKRETTTCIIWSYNSSNVQWSYTIRI